MTDPDLASDILALLSDPTAVFLNMLRGGIAKPSLVNIWHLYGQELADAMPAEFRVREPKVAREAVRDTDFAWTVPRHATEEMMQAGLYHCSADMTHSDLFTAWHSMVDAAVRDNDAPLAYHQGLDELTALKAEREVLLEALDAFAHIAEAAALRATLVTSSVEGLDHE